MKKYFNIILMAAFTIVSFPAISEETVEVPVLKNSLRKGDTIAEQDIKLIEVPTDKVRNNIITNPDQLVGKTPKKHLQAGKLIRVPDVSTPVVVEKGKMTTLVFQTENMELSTVGVALDNGSVGDAVRVKNNESGRIIHGTVIKAGVVAVGRNLQTLASNG